MCYTSTIVGYILHQHTRIVGDVLHLRTRILVYVLHQHTRIVGYVLHLLTRILVYVLHQLTEVVLYLCYTCTQGDRYITPRYSIIGTGNGQVRRERGYYNDGQQQCSCSPVTLDAASVEFMTGSQHASGLPSHEHTVRTLQRFQQRF